MPKMPLPPAESITLDSLAEVARGGMGMVELARAMDGRLQGQVLAVKRLHANIAEDPDFVSMFLDETWMTAALKHANVAQVVAWGNDPKGMFLAIELVQGVSLSRLLKEAQQNQEPFAERTVAYICSQICGALVAAHTLATPDGTPLSLVHRDLTPANVLVSFDGTVKVIDFGIAKAEERISHTRTGQLKGKPAYMAPEQQRGDSVDARADLFAFGVVMFELLAGRRPWTSKGAFDVMMEISNDPHPSLGELRRGLNPEFVAIAHKCLEKKPQDRFQSAGEIKARLDAWLSAKGFSADDAQSLANFVQRNCQPQVLWWQQALRGEHAVKKAPTFKELEEKIDEEREAAARKDAKPAPPLPAAGNKLQSTVPMRAYPAPPAAGSKPIQGLQLPPASVRGFGGTTPMVMTPEVRAAMGRKLVAGGGTAFLAVSPFAIPDVPRGNATDTPPPSRPAEDRDPPSVPGPDGVPSWGPPPGSGPRSANSVNGAPINSSSIPPSGAPEASRIPSTPPASMGAQSGLASVSQNAASLVLPDSAKLAPPSRKRSRAPVILAICIAIAAGIGGGAWLALGQGLGPLRDLFGQVKNKKK